MLAARSVSEVGTRGPRAQCRLTSSVTLNESRAPLSPSLRAVKCRGQPRGLGPHRVSSSQPLLRLIRVQPGEAGRPLGLRRQKELSQEGPAPPGQDR